MSNDQQIESEIKAKGLTAPRITPTDIEAAIRSEHYFTASEGVFGAETNPHEKRDRSGHILGDFPLMGVTICALVLRNGFTVIGKSACASPLNFNVELGRKIAREDAVDQIWALLGYELRSQLAADAKLAASMPKAPEGWGAYTGTKQLLAKPMTLGEYNEYRGWEIPQGEHPNDAGYLVEYTDGGKPNDSRHAGYISWSPADVFERAYRQIG